MDALIRVGFLRKTHGIQGFIRFEPDTDPSGWLKTGAIIFAGSGADDASLCEVVSVKQTAGGEWMIQLKGREVIENIRPLVNQIVFLSESDFRTLESEQETGNFSGYTLYNGNRIAGTIVDLMETPAHPVLVVLLSNEKTVMVPLVPAWIVSEQKRQRRLVMNLPEGLLEI